MNAPERTRELIIELKRRKDAVILAHNYQRAEIQDLADFVGDSLELARQAARVEARAIVFCGVWFMAETAKILAPDKLVLLPNRLAGCPMADMVTARELEAFKARYPGAAVVSYVNTNAEVKAVSDVCCTSANAVEIVRNLAAERIIFVPDRNLASYCQRFTTKEIVPWDGFCYVHNRMTAAEMLKAKGLMPDAALMVHPECPPEVVDVADEVLSTGGMIRFANGSERRRFLVGTEEGLIHRLRKENPEKEFYAAGTPKVCFNMKLTTLDDVLAALRNETHQMEVPPEIARRARRALDKMLDYTGSR